MIGVEKFDKFIYVIILLVLCCGCQQIDDTPTELEDTEWSTSVRSMVGIEKKLIVGQVVNNEQLLFFPRYIVQTANNLIALNLSGDSLANIFSHDGLLRLGAFAKKGKGPREFQTIWDYSRSVRDIADLWLFDMASQRMHYWSSTGSNLAVSRSNYDPVIFQLDAQYPGRVLHATELGDGRFATTGTFLNSKVRIYNSTGEPISEIGKLPKPKEGESPAVVQHKYSSYITSRTNENVFAIAGVYVDEVEIFDADKRHKISIIGPDGIEPIYRTDSGRPIRTKESKLAYQSLASTKDYIFALLSGTSPSEFENEDLAFYGKEIVVIDWNGNVVEHFITNEYLFSITVSSDGHSIYGVQHYPSVKLIKYELGL